MMSRCCGQDACGCKVQGSTNVDVTGKGSATDPYIVSIPAPLSPTADFAWWARIPETLLVDTIVRDAMTQVALSGDVVWPDGNGGAYTADTFDPSSGAVDSYHITYTGSPPKTYTQPPVTRNGSGSVIDLPQIVVS